VFNTESCTLFNLEASTGRKLWHNYLGDPTLTQAALHGNLVLATHPAGSTSNWHLSAYRKSNGGEIWGTSIDGELLSAPVIYEDSAYFSTVKGTLYKVSVATGAKSWSRSIKATTAPWLSKGALYIGKKDGDREQMAVIDPARGEIIATDEGIPAKHLGDLPKDLSNWEQVWKYEGSRPLVIDGVRYVAMGERVTATDAKTGKTVWERRYFWDERKGGPEVNPRALASAAYANGTLVVAARGGEVYGVDVKSGRTRWAFDFDAPLQSQPIVANGWVYLTTSNGMVIAVQAGDNTLDGWHMWGGGPGHNGPKSNAF